MKAKSLDLIKQLRESTGAGILECKKALLEAGQDLEKATQILRKKGIAIASQKSTRATGEGCVGSYVHMGAKLGVLVEVDCETDFVARNAEFKRFVKDIAMQIAASKPTYLRREDVPNEVIEAQGQDSRELFFQQACLLEQPFIKDQNSQVKDYLTSTIAKLGENVVIRRFVRFQVGEELEK